jgi:signal transduction histidine kinase/ligand-binding sensor domain-containing protein
LPVVDGTDIHFRHLATVTGLSQTRVSQIVQDDQGFLWFGTQNGLNRFDGYQYKVFGNEPGQSKSLSGVYVYSLFKDSSGALWVGTDQSLDRFDSKTETFTHYSLEPGGENGVPVIVIDISEDHAGVLWLATYFGLFSLNPKTGSVARFIHDPNDPESLSSMDVKSSTVDSKGRLWITTSESVDLFDKTTGKVLRRVPLSIFGHACRFYEDRHGVFWIYCDSSDGLATFDEDANSITRYYFYDAKSRKPITLGVTAMLEDKEGALWISTNAAGLFRLDRDRQSVIAYRSSSGNAESLGDDHLTTLFEDGEGNVWIGLHSTAPNVFNRRARPFRALRFQHADANRFVGQLVTTFYEDSPGKLWLGLTGAFVRMNLKTGEHFLSSTVGPGIHKDTLTIVKDSADHLWVGTAGEGVGRLDKATGCFHIYRHDPKDPRSLSDNLVSRLLIDHAGNMWATTWDGLDRFDPSSDSFEVYRPEGQGKSSAVYGTIMEGPDGILWVSGLSGLHRFDPATRKFTIFRHDPHKPTSISNNRVVSAYIDRSGTMWVATKNGLNRFDASSNTFHTFSEHDGLAGNAIECMLEDRVGNLWMSTNKGISKLDVSRKHFTNYSIADGLPGEDLTGWGTCLKSSTGEMFFGGFSGATTFRPDEIVAESYAPPVVVTDLKLSGVPVEIGPHSPLQKAINFENKIKLSHEQNIFSFTFAALSFLDPTTNRYRYKLEGLDQEWVETGSDRRSATYTTLPPGTYNFRVQGAIGSGPWSEPGVMLRLEILPPWWRTSWFIAISATLLLLAMLAAYYYRLRKMAQQFEILLEERVNERTRIARDLHDTLLQSFHALLLRFQAVSELLAPGDVKQKLDNAIDQTAQAVTEGRDAVRGLRLSTTISNDLAAALNSLGLELATVQENSNSPQFRIAVEGATRDLYPLLRDEVFRIAGEALRNAFRHAQATHIDAGMRYDKHEFRLRISDDGKGFDTHAIDLGEPVGHFGLRGMRERAKLIGGRLELRSEAECGTVIELLIPATLAYANSATRRRFWFSRKLKAIE